MFQKKEKERKHVQAGLKSAPSIAVKVFSYSLLFALPRDPAGGLNGPLDPRPLYTLLATLLLDSNHFTFCFEVFKCWQIC